MPDNTAALIINRLIDAFPACFAPSAPKPLKIGIGKELLALVGVHPALTDISRKQLRVALAIYAGTGAYRKALAQGGDRYGLDGQPAGEVTPEQKKVAADSRKKKPATAASKEPVAPPIDTALLLQEVMAMAIPAKLDVTIKLNQLPHAKPASPKTMLFAVQAGNRTVVVEVKNKAWNTLKEAAERYPQWVAAITGQPGADLPNGGFRLENAAMQVFEKKQKTATEASSDPATSPTASAPPAAAAPKPAPAPTPPVSVLNRPKLSLKNRTEK